MHFATWFHEHFRRQDEAEYPAVHRLACETRLGWTTVLRAVKGTKLRTHSAEVLSAATGGAVSVDELRAAPTRPELAARKRKPRTRPRRKAAA